MATASTMRNSILLVEDDPAHGSLMREQLEELGANIDHVMSRAAAVEALEGRDYDVVVLDARLPDGSGFELQKWILRREKAPPIVFVTADDRAESAVEAVQSGAAHYVVKRASYLERMKAAVAAVFEGASFSAGRHVPALGGSEGDLIGESPSMVRVRQLIDEYGPTEAPVLISGETGTGKDLVAQALHRASVRANGPFVAVNCAAISASLFESELFGSERGAYTGAVRDRRGLVGAASSGTLFLDEVSELPPEAQAKLLRLTEGGIYRPVGGTQELRADVRVMAATNRDLQLAVERGEFRDDLYYRLNVLRVHLPALKERREDIPLLVAHFLNRLGARGMERQPTAGALAQLMALSWPGNVRELKHAIERTILRAGGGPLYRFELDMESQGGSAPARRSAVTADNLAELLARHRGRLGPVARELGISIRTVQRRMKDLGFRLRDFRKFSS